MTEASRSILLYLQRIYRRLWLRTGLLGAVVGLGVGALLVGIEIVRRVPVSLEWMALPLLGGIAGAVWAAWRYRSIEGRAQLVEARAPLQSYLLSAVERLSSSPPEESPGLVARLLVDTASRLALIRPARVIPLAPPRTLWLPVAALATLTLTGWALSSTPDASPVQATALPEAPPVVGDLALVLEYPNYTKLPPRTIEGLSGPISALVGTRVSLSTRADRPVRAAYMAFDGSDRSIPLVVQGERELRAQFPLLEGGTFRFVIETTDGARVAGPPQEMKAEPDLAPTVEVTSPQDGISLHLEDTLDIEVTVEDDFGLSSIQVAFQVQGAPTPQVMKITSFKREEGKSSFQGVLHQPLSGLRLREGDRVQYTVEAYDNDAVSGAKRGASVPRGFVVFSSKEKHEELIERQSALVDLLVTLLADRMEKPFPPVLPGEAAPEEEAVVAVERATAAFAELAQQGESLMVEADGIAGALVDDPLSHPEVSSKLREIAANLTVQARIDRELLRGLRVALSFDPVPSGVLAAPRSKNEAAITVLEEDIIALEQLVNRQRAESLRALGDEIAAARDRVKELIAEYERTKDPALKAEIERELARLEAALKAYNEALSKMRQEIPDEFFNLEALKPEGMEDSLSEAKKAVAAGDIERAKEALDELSKSFDDASQALDEEAQRFADEQSRELDQALEKIADGLASARDREKELRRLTQEIEERGASRAEDANKAAIEEAKKKAEEKRKALDAILGRLVSADLGETSRGALAVSKQRSDDLAASLAAPGIYAQVSVAETLAQALEGLVGAVAEEITVEELRSDLFGRLEGLKGSRGEAKDAQSLAQEIVEILRKAAPAPSKFLTPEEKAELARLQREQEAIREELARLGSELEGIEEKLPGVAEATQELREQAAASMEAAAKALSAGDPREAGAQEEEALKALGSLQREVKQAGRRGGKPQRRPNEKVQIPSAEEHKPPKALREEILQGSREAEKAPAKLRDTVKRYYEELLR